MAESSVYDHDVNKTSLKTSNVKSNWYDYGVNGKRGSVPIFWYNNHGIFIVKSNEGWKIRYKNAFDRERLMEHKRLN